MVSNKNSYFTVACRAFHASSLQWYHILIILTANSMITQIQKLWRLYYIRTQYSSVPLDRYTTTDPVWSLWPESKKLWQ